MRKQTEEVDDVAGRFPSSVVRIDTGDGPRPEIYKQVLRKKLLQNGIKEHKNTFGLFPVCLLAARLKHISDTLKMAPKLNENGIPSFDSLPLREGDPHHSAWGLYGDNDQLGTLNRLTDERVAAAAKGEIQKGIRYGCFTNKYSTSLLRAQEKTPCSSFVTKNG